MTTGESTQIPLGPRLTVVRVDQGWEIREERDNRIVRVTHHTDWHRVERSLQQLERALAADGSKT